MKTNSLFWALTWAAVGSLAVMQGCGGDDDDDGGDGGDDKGGSSGSGGTTGGSSGSGGKGGTSGSSGSAGKGGTAGTTSTGGSGGAPGGEGGGGGVPGGGGEAGGGPQTRGEVCVDYCTAYFTNGCGSTTTNPANSYADQPTCEFVCANTLAWDVGSTGEVGNTIWCRLDHANNAAAAANRTLHCGHASENSTGVCVD